MYLLKSLHQKVDKVNGQVTTLTRKISEYD
jgi:hypothetical protein